MSKITVYKCNGCGNIVEHASEVFRIELHSRGTYWDGVESNTQKIDNDFCEKCAKDVKKSLRKIADALGN